MNWQRLLLYSFGALLAFILISNVAVHTRSRPYIYESVADVPNVTKTQTALILGAAVYGDGELSPVLRYRADKAIELYAAAKVDQILASGDNSTVEHNEVNPVRDYLLEQGIPEENIYLDHAGFDTYSAMYRARDIFQAESLIIVTQAFHLPRAVFIARALGLQAYGVPARDGEENTKNYLREILANEKAVLNLFFRREPKFLGEAIPIE